MGDSRLQYNGQNPHHNKNFHLVPKSEQTAETFVTPSLCPDNAHAVNTQILFAFLAGLLLGILVNSLYRAAMINKIKDEFERELREIERRSRTVAPTLWSQDVTDAIENQENDRRTGT
jgi:hypothetical protein